MKRDTWDSLPETNSKFAPETLGLVQMSFLLGRPFGKCHVSFFVVFVESTRRVDRECMTSQYKAGGKAIRAYLQWL